MNKILPSRRIFYVFIACLIAVSTVVFAAEYPQISAAIKTKNEKVAYSDSGNTAPTVTGTVTDTPKAGATNTGGDYGVKNLLGNTAAANSAATKAKTGAPENLTNTDQFGRDFFAKYLDARRDPSFDSTTFVKDYIDQTPGADAATQYTKRDIRVTSSQGDQTEALRQYGNSVALMITNDSPKGVPNEIDTLNHALQTNSPGELSQLDPIISGYEKLIGDLLATAVPIPASDLHLALINTLSAIHEDIQGFKKTFSDPIVAIKSVGKFKTDTATLKNNLSDLANLFDSKNVVFSQTDYGTMFAQF